MGGKEKSHLISILLLVHMCAQLSAVYYSYDTYGYCKLLPLHAKLPDLESCNCYTQCSDLKHKCCATGRYFDKDSQMCKPPEEVKCFDLLTPCQRSNASIIADPDECRGFITCKENKEIDRSLCGQGKIFDEDLAKCITGSCYNEGFKDAHTCDFMPAYQMFATPETCSRWQLCNGSELETGKCSENMIFSLEQQKFIPFTKYEKNCLPQRINATCSPMYYYTSHPYVCTTRYKCWGDHYNNEHCLDGRYFDVARSACLVRQEAKPHPNCNRCEYATNTQWVNAVDPECRRYTVCHEGLPAAEGSCAANQYFDEERQACIVGLQNMEEYREHNGACRLVD